MPLPLPNLDDRTHDDLVKTLRNQITGFSKHWTDHNFSDPGITILELLCWLAEMVVYRLNRVTERSVTNFLKLVLDPPVPVTAEVKFKIWPQATDIVIPAGTRFSTAPSLSPVEPHAEPVLFETFQTITIPAAIIGSPPIGSPPEPVVTDPFYVRNVSEIFKEQLGKSDGTPNQLFTFKSTPVLIDEESAGTASDGYNPNPEITVNGERWRFVRDLLDLDPASGSEEKCFMIEKIINRVRFGNGILGKIPSKDAVIKCEKYQVIRGDEVKIGKNALKEMLNPPDELDPHDIVEIFNEEAEGGLYIYPLAQAKTTGLLLRKERYRAVTEEDFEFIATEVFNASQVSQLRINSVARAKAIPNRNLKSSDPSAERDGEVSIIVVPRPRDGEDTKPVPSDDLMDKVWRLLDKRRLITTRVHVVGPEYVPVSIDVQVARKPNTLADTIWKSVENKLRQFMDPINGGPDRNGWPFGRNVYKSELFNLIENIDGIDHVKGIVFDGSPTKPSVEIGERQLVHLINIKVTD
jgi:hypothetical protein